MWDVKVTHPNVISPIYTGKVRVFPQPRPTFLPIPIPEVVFRDTPIRDIPDANLAPVQQAVTCASEFTRADLHESARRSDSRF